MEAEPDKLENVMFIGEILDDQKKYKEALDY